MLLGTFLGWKCTILWRAMQVGHDVWMPARLSGCFEPPNQQHSMGQRRNVDACAGYASALAGGTSGNGSHAGLGPPKSHPCTTCRGSKHARHRRQRTRPCQLLGQCRGCLTDQGWTAPPNLAGKPGRSHFSSPATAQLELAGRCAMTLQDLLGIAEVKQNMACDREGCGPSSPRVLAKLSSLVRNSFPIMSFTST